MSESTRRRVRTKNLIILLQPLLRWLGHCQSLRNQSSFVQPIHHGTIRWKTFRWVQSDERHLIRSIWSPSQLGTLHRQHKVIHSGNVEYFNHCHKTLLRLHFKIHRISILPLFLLNPTPLSLADVHLKRQLVTHIVMSLGRKMTHRKRQSIPHLRSHPERYLVRALVLEKLENILIYTAGKKICILVALISRGTIVGRTSSGPRATLTPQPVSFGKLEWIYTEMEARYTEDFHTKLHGFLILPLSLCAPQTQAPALQNFIRYVRGYELLLLLLGYPFHQGVTDRMVNRPLIRQIHLVSLCP